VGVADTEQFETAETRLVRCAVAELLGLGDGVALRVGDGEVEEVADAELAVAAGDGQVSEGDAEAAADAEAATDADGDEPLPPAGLMVQMNDANPEAPVASLAATVTRLMPAVVGVPEIRPAELIDRPAGSPAAV
jgi:hypothetical protein